MGKGNDETWMLVFGVLSGLLLRFCISLHPYSGQGKPPMFGDYEAQRHWMEITTNLPAQEWYQNTTLNNLQYWGLDYPPLTAFHMFICGKIASFLEPKYVELGLSHGLETEGHKNFMRSSVLISDLIVFVPAIVIYFITTKKVHKNILDASRTVKNSKAPSLSPALSVFGALLYPGLILIDHGHFQYNSISLGLLVLSVTFILHEGPFLGAFCFVLSLNYKQMELYHALPYFLYLLSSCVPKHGQNWMQSFAKLTKIGLCVIVTFGILWGPFLIDLDTFRLTPDTVLQVLKRQFPFSRGVFEDKVSNFWCVFNIFYKLKNCNQEKVLRFCLLATLSAGFPSFCDLFLRPSRKKFVLSLINSSLAFFLFSFQVHEKTILVVAIPVILFLPQRPVECFWFLYISTFSMLPLFIKDGLVIAYFGLNFFYLVSVYLILKSFYQINNNLVRKYILSTQDTVNFLFHTPNLSNLFKNVFKKLDQNKICLKSYFLTLCVFLSILISVILSIVSITVSAPEKYPDLFALLVSAFSCIHFIGFFIFFNVLQFRIPQEYGAIQIHVKNKSL